MHSSYLAIQQRKPVDYVIAVAVAALALVIVILGLGEREVETIEPAHPPIETRIIQQAPATKQAAPPPPPPAMVEPPAAPFVPPPKIAPPPPPRAIQHVSHEKPPKVKTQTKLKPKAKTVSKAASASSSSDSAGKHSNSASGTPGGAAGDHSAGAVPINNVRPDYPDEAQEENREGTVTASCDISATGKPMHCRILSVKGGRDFADSAMEFLEHSGVRYQPAISNGQPVVEHNHVLHLDYTLDD
ncbi:energy transducer TonB [Formicincola oecophyllae]|uniref:Protein TonB n=1 Tax=Formicincola oecophyllae TaxID=2558361 RepID=A0A4Y6UB34_9PROT|nr:energy transducer TonB [Formicincola oecophyllae]QDH13335.1 energy transducer TonB [Formicincola oecophyllae]